MSLVLTCFIIHKIRIVCPDRILTGLKENMAYTNSIAQTLQCTHFLLTGLVYVQTLQWEQVNIQIECAPIYHSIIFQQTEISWFRIPSLRFWCDGSNFDEAKSHLQHAIHTFSMFVETSSQPDRRIKFKSPHFRFLEKESSRRKKKKEPNTIFRKWFY